MRRRPNGYGSITKLSGNRARPWVIKVTIYDEHENPKQVPIGYAPTEEKAMSMLAKYNDSPWNLKRETITLSDLVSQWERLKAPRLSVSLKKSVMTGYKHCAYLSGVKYRLIKAIQMQESVDRCAGSISTQNKIKNFWYHIDRFAMELDVVDKTYSQLVTVGRAPDTKRTPFSSEEIATLWKYIDTPWVDMVLIFIYTGFRKTELIELECRNIDVTNWTITGGIKSDAGKNRIVPVHPKIQPLVKNRMTGTYLFMENGCLIPDARFYTLWNSVMKLIGAKKTPHEARHTFETLLDNAGGNRKCIDMLMGHKSMDIGNRVYNHKTLEQLRETVELVTN